MGGWKRGGDWVGGIGEGRKMGRWERGGGKGGGREREEGWG